MSPDQRHRTSRRATEEQFALRDIFAIPDLLGQEPAWACGSLERGQKAFCFLGASSGEFVMRALARQQRPEPADADAIERRAVCALTITVVVVSIPIGTGG